MEKQRACGQKTASDSAFAVNRAYGAARGRERTGSVTEARRCVALQEAFCARRGVPMFAPASGVCPNCGRQIFGGEGYREEQAGSELITGCPYCSKTFCD